MKNYKYFLTSIICALCCSCSCFANDNYGDHVTACVDLEIIYARGSGGELNATKEFDEVAKAGYNISSEYHMSVYVHDLGYSAIAMNSPIKLIGVFVSAGKAYSFGNSVSDGMRELRKHFSERYSDCPDTQFVLVGYSQGAMVVANSVKYLHSKNIAFVMLLGDPNTYLPEGAGLFPAACHGGALSSWRTHAPNCRTHEGVFGGRKPYEYGTLTGKYSLWCNRNDYICGSSKNPLRNSGHTTYASSGEISWGLSLLAKKYLKPKGGGTERPIIHAKSFDAFDDSLVDDGGVTASAPGEILLWRESDVIKMTWDKVPDSAKNLLIRLNGYDLGYIDASLGKFEIRDVDFGVENKLSLLWMDATGELSEVYSVNVKALATTSPIGAPTKPVQSIQPVQAVEGEKTNDLEQESANKGSDTNEPVNDVVVSGNDSKSKILPSGHASGLSFMSKTEAINIVVSLLGTSGLLAIFFVKRRQG